jgi:hypothetical protein
LILFLLYSSSFPLLHFHPFFLSISLFFFFYYFLAFYRSVYFICSSSFHRPFLLLRGLWYVFHTLSCLFSSLLCYSFSFLISPLSLYYGGNRRHKFSVLLS